MKRYCPALKELKIESRKENVLNRLRLRNQHRTILNEKKKKSAQTVRFSVLREHEKAIGA